jgi:predicted transcriptional regulator
MSEADPVGCAHSDADDGERTRALDRAPRDATSAVTPNMGLLGQTRCNPMRRLVLRMPDALIERIDRLADAMNQRPRVQGTGRASRAGVTRTLIAAMLRASKEGPMVDAAWAFARRRRPGEHMRRVVLRMPDDMVERIAKLRAELHAQQPAEPWSRALVMRGLLAACLTSPRPAVLLEAAHPTGGAADRGEA